MTFSFIHAADIHLGRPFSNISENSEICKKATQKSFNNLIEHALNKNIDFVLIAGDTFDSEEQDFESKLILKEGLKKLESAGIKVYLICGNHDPLSSYNKTTFNFDENSKIKIVGLNSQIYEDFTVENKNNEPVALIHALSFAESQFKENPIKYFSQAQNLFNIGLLHCDLDASKDSPYAPCLKSELEALNYDYWALGHIHIPNEMYAGTLQGRNTKETGAHGAKYVKVENGIITKNLFVPLDVVRFEDITVDLSSAVDDVNAAEIILEKLEILKNEECEYFYIRLHLTGYVDFYSKINDEFIEKLQEKITTYSKISISKIINNTVAKIDAEALSNDEGIAGELYTVVQNEENIQNAFLKTEKQLKQLLTDCCFEKGEYETFCEEIKESTKETCKNLCSLVYGSESKED